MKFKQGGQDKKKARVTLDLTPLIDVVFQLVIFFMLTSTFVTNRAIPIEMPQAEGGADIMGEDMSISITVEDGGPGGEGQVYLNDAPIEGWDQLTNTLVDYHAARPEGAVTIRTDRRVPSGRMVEVLGYVTNAGIESINIAAEQPQEGS
jgi:biopolymer transport protein ExbD